MKFSVYKHLLNDATFVPLCDITSPVDETINAYMTLIYDPLKEQINIMITDVIAMYGQKTDVQIESSHILKDEYRKCLHLSINMYGSDIQHIATQAFDNLVLLAGYDRCRLIDTIKTEKYSYLYPWMEEEIMVEESWNRYYHAKAKMIQKRWRFVVSCPYHAICRRRIEREFQELEIVNI